MNLYLVRHGQTNWNLNSIVQGRIDNPLNSTGMDQAKQTGEKLKKMNISFDKLYISPLTRAKQTAEIINEYLKIEDVEINEGLNEREFGVLEGMDVPEMRKLCKSIDYVPQGFETDEEIISRVRNTIDGITQNNFKNVLLVCHSHTIKSFLISIDNSYTFDFELLNAQAVHIEFINNKYIIKGIK